MHGNSYYLSGSKLDSSSEGKLSFYEGLVYPLIKSVFKLEPSHNFEVPYITVESQAHANWLRYIGFNGNRTPDWRGLNKKQRSEKIHLLDRAFYFGMVAGLLRESSKGQKFPFSGYRQKHQDVFFELASSLGYDVKTKPNLFLNREAVEVLMKERFELQANGFRAPHIGAFYNPAHLDFLCNRFVERCYLFKPS